MKLSKRYRIDVKLTGYAEIVVEAVSLEDAMDKANTQFTEVYMAKPIHDLCWKDTELSVVSEE